MTPPCSAVSPPSRAVRTVDSPRRCPPTSTLESLGVECADRHVVEQEERLGAHADQVVDQHGHQVDADRVVATELARDLELGAHAVGRGDEHRLAVRSQVEGEEPAEAADAAEHLGSRVESTTSLMRSTELVTRRRWTRPPARRSARRRAGRAVDSPATARARRSPPGPARGSCRSDRRRSTPRRARWPRAGSRA